MTDSRTKRQHYISQVEQRLNAINPDAKPRNQRIYEFEIVARDEHIARLTGVKGRAISGTLSMFDVFSFDVGTDGATRANFEDAFARYETQLMTMTAALLRAHQTQSSEVAQELFGLFVAKMVNFIRNPYSVVKMINTFGVLAQLTPVNPVIHAAYQRILKGRRPQQAFLCKMLGISDDQYSVWLRLLFMLLTPLADGVSNLFEQSLNSLLVQKDHALHVHIHVYQTERCLVSDRGVTSPIPQEAHLVLDFNLCAHAFIRYAFLDYHAVLGRPIPEGVLAGLHSGPKQVQVSYLTDDYAALDVFHRRILEQSYERIYCSTAQPYGVVVKQP
jgi:hypothetical protein